MPGFSAWEGNRPSPDKTTPFHSQVWVGEVIATVFFKVGKKLERECIGEESRSLCAPEIRANISLKIKGGGNRTQ